MKKALILPIALFALAALPARAHHEHAYGIFWKPGTRPEAKNAQGEIWRHAFVSKFSWSCGIPQVNR